MTNNINTTIVEGYIQLMNNLTTDSKLDIISRLTLSIKSDISVKKSKFKKSFGAFESKQTAEELIEEITTSRTFTRKIESF